MKLKLILLSVLSLSLMGCQPSSDSSDPKSQDTSNEEDEKDTLTNSVIDTPTSTTDEGDNKKEDISNSTNSETEEGSSKKSDDDDDDDDDEFTNPTKWEDGVYKTMVKCLGGSVLPYVDMGKFVEATWTNATTSKEGYLTIAGDKTLDSTLLNTCKTAYEAEKWTVESSSTAMAALLDAKGLTVNIKADTSGYIYIVVNYETAFNLTAASTYDADVTTQIQTYMHTHSIPYISLGASFDTYTYSINNRTLTLTQGVGFYDASILTNAETVLKADGWTTSEGTATTYSSVLVGTKTFTDDCEITITVKSTSTTNTTYKKGLMTIELVEGYHYETYTGWPSGISTYTAKMDNHSIPNIYLGATSFGVTDSTTYYNKISISGGRYREQIIEDAKTTMKNEAGWEVEEGTTYTKPSLLAYTTFTDGCRMQFRVYAASSSDTARAYMEVHYEEGYIKGSSQTDWDSETESSIETYFGTATKIPYVHLNTNKPTTSYTSSSNTLTITGTARYNSGIAEQAILDYTADGWTCTRKASIDGIGMVAVKEAKDAKYTVTITASSYYTTTAKMTIKAEDNFYVPTDPSTTWPDAVITNMKNYFGDYVLPYVYLGAKTPTSTYTSSSKTLTITGGIWDDSIYTLFETALTTKETVSTLKWSVATVTDATNGEERVATGIDTSKDVTYTVTLYKNTSKKPVITMTYKETFANPTNGEWTSSIKTLMDTNFASHYAPYIYLGTINPSGSYTASYGKITITGGTWDDQIYDIATTALKTDGYTMETYRNSYGKALGAYKINTDGTGMRITVYRNSSATSAKAIMDVFYAKAGASDTLTDWSASTKTTISSYVTDYTLPYLSTGTTQMTAKTNTTTGGLTFTYSKTSQFTFIYIYNAMVTLKNAGWDVKVDWTSSTYPMKILASYTTSTGSNLYVSFYATSLSYAYLYLTYSAPYSTSSTSGDTWSETAKSTMTSKLNGYVLPYLYLGKAASSLTVTSSSTSTYSYVTLSAGYGLYDTAMETELQKLLSADTERTWTFGYDYASPTNGKTFVAVAENSDGSYYTVKLYGYSYSTYNIRCTRLSIYYVY